MTETGKSIPEVAQHMGINETTPASGVSRARKAVDGLYESTDPAPDVPETAQGQ
ncbi:sigma-70 region 4 domain-containing protein [Streptomyces hirsutus]|uniref:hypothetical protein n=1 Tax=Streptomyces hirsutus TaxID=35620 RepID=UPI00386F3392|nr:sigma-70 region 4 domain-containing protein [Streptomyces hirsutus]